MPRAASSCNSFRSATFCIGLGLRRFGSGGKERRGKLVPVEGIEPPTFGLQNRCTTAVLNRHEGRIIVLERPASKRGM